MAFNKQHFINLKGVLKGYVKDINLIIAETLINDKHLENVYSEEYLSEIRKGRIETGRRKIKEKQESTRTRVNSIIKNLREDVSSWVDTPVDQDLLSRLQTIKVIGIKMTMQEIELLAEKSAGQYLPLKILAELAGENGYLLNAPSAELYLKEIKDIESGCNILLNMYCGPNAEGIDLIPHDVRNGIDYGRYEPWICISAAYILKPDNALDKAAEHWGDTMTHVQQKMSLTGEETEYIGSLFKGHGGGLAERTKELLLINPSLKDVIALSEYAEYLPDEQ